MRKLTTTTIALRIYNCFRTKKLRKTRLKPETTYRFATSSYLLHYMIKVFCESKWKSSVTIKLIDSTEKA
jgi:hypothetical protein